MNNLNRANNALSRMFEGFSQKRKICSTCKELKVLGDFHKHSKAKDGFQSSCKQCQSRRVKASYRLRKDSLLNCKQCKRSLDSSLFYEKRKGEGKMSICKDCYGKNTSLGMAKSKMIQSASESLFEAKTQKPIDDSEGFANVINPLFYKCFEKIDYAITELVNSVVETVVETIQKGTK